MNELRMKKESMTISFGLEGYLSRAMKEALMLACEQDIKVNFSYGNYEYSVDPASIINTIEESGTLIS